MNKWVAPSVRTLSSHNEPATLTFHLPHDFRLGSRDENKECFGHSCERHVRTHVTRRTPSLLIQPVLRKGATRTPRHKPDSVKDRNISISPVKHVFQESGLTSGISILGFGLETPAHLYTSLSRNITVGNFVLSKAARPSIHMSPLGRTTPGATLSGVDSEPPKYVLLEAGVPFSWLWGGLALAESSLASISASFIWRFAKASAEGAVAGGAESE